MTVGTTQPERADPGDPAITAPGTASGDHLEIQPLERNAGQRRIEVDAGRNDGHPADAPYGAPPEAPITTDRSAHPRNCADGFKHFF
ncbi:hypothetical protein LUV28_40070, partial [Streptomyces sp. 8ZJF_21]|nr:hypothetical protein [Streptomyces sp. 8ZJF_21]